MDLDDLCDLDLAYLLIFGGHPDMSVGGANIEACETSPTENATC